MNESVPQLVIVRGNSGAGKTTLAMELQRLFGPGTANIGQDHLRRVVLREHDVPDGDNIGLIDNTVRYCLGIGCHVILEGILFSDHYGAMLRELVDDHPGCSHVFYLDVPLEETLRRHQERPLRDSVPDDLLRDWYVPYDVLGIPDEIVLDGTVEAQETLRRVTDQIGPLPSRESRGTSRFI